MQKTQNITLLFLFIVLLFACGVKENKQSTVKTSAQLTGKENFNNHCIACHGSDGNMGVAGAKKLPTSVLTQQEREDIISAGKGNMPAFKDKLSIEEINKVAEYTLTLTQ